MAAFQKLWLIASSKADAMDDSASRRRRIEELCRAALERPVVERPAFLAAACGDDAALRVEIEGLLKHEAAETRFLDPSIGRVAAQVLSAADSSNPGTVFGHYRIVERLGSGGMGVVYRADDSKLRRPVALKFLPADATQDVEARRRFITEAQAASALDHPNICTIYEVDETPAGQMFIAMAFYAGETLKTRIDRGPLRLDAVIDFATQMAQGLVKAHAAGIVHRDIKPANVLVTDDGLVKILDFGIAKLTGHADATRTGTTVGTLSYMSPEQLRGERVDARSDLWSLGVVLYEMVAGQPPFAGDHPEAIALGVRQSAQEPLTAIRTGIPMALERIVDRALAKSADDRYQTAADMLSELRRVKRETGTRSNAPDVAARDKPRVPIISRSRLIGAIAMALVGIATLVYRFGPWRQGDEGVSRLTNPTQVAATIGEERLPSWSVDGRMLVYQSDQTGNNDIWVTQIGGAAVDRTSDFLGNDEAPRLSPDGRQIAFWSARDGGGLYLMPTLSGTPRRIAPGRPDVAMAPAWSPDGAELAYALVGPAAGGDPRLEILNVRTGAVRRVTLPRARAANPGPAGCLDAAWSPDRLFIACAAGNSYNNQTNRLWVIRLSDQAAFPINEDKVNQWSPSWSPESRTLYFTSNLGGTMDLWQQRLKDTGEPVGASERLTTGLDTLQATLTADGRHVAYAKGRRVANVWRVPILRDHLASWADAEQVTIDQRYIEAFDLSPDGQRLVVASDRGGHDDLWILPAVGGDMQQLTDDPTPDWWPAWSPDGREVAFYSNRMGNRQLWVQPVAAGPGRRLTEKSSTLFPRWSRDGKSIFFVDDRSISSVPASGGESRQIMKIGPEGPSTMEFSFAPDGASFAATYGRLPDRRLWRFPAAGGDGLALTKGQAASPSWSPDGAWIYFTTFRDGSGATYQLERSGLNIWRVSSDGVREVPVTRLTGRHGYLGLKIANDGKYIYFTWREDVSDIWMMDVEYGKR